MATTTTLKVTGLGRKRMNQLTKDAKRLGLSNAQYAKRLLEEALDIGYEARTKSFAEIFAPIREEFRMNEMTEDELDKLVDRARTRHHQRSARQQKRG